MSGNAAPTAAAATAAGHASSSTDQRERKLGSIASVRMINFMCHENLLVEFCPGVNFVVGENGSGKSAVFTALLCAFGGAARQSGRARNAGELIRRGCATATIEVVLRNDGEERFQDGSTEDWGFGPGEYGETLSIERKIHEKGGGYVVRDEQGNVRGRTFDLVARIRDFFNIQVPCHLMHFLPLSGCLPPPLCLSTSLLLPPHPVAVWCVWLTSVSLWGRQTENPILLMGQDASRQFLQSSTPGEKFELIHRAIQMSKIDSELEHTVASLREVERSVQAQEKEAHLYVLAWVAGGKGGCVLR